MLGVAASTRSDVPSASCDASSRRASQSPARPAARPSSSQWSTSTSSSRSSSRPVMRGSARVGKLRSLRGHVNRDNHDTLADNHNDNMHDHSYNHDFNHNSPQVISAGSCSRFAPDSSGRTPSTVGSARSTTSGADGDVSLLLGGYSGRGYSVRGGGSTSVLSASGRMGVEDGRRKSSTTTLTPATMERAARESSAVHRLTLSSSSGVSDTSTEWEGVDIKHDSGGAMSFSLDGGVSADDLMSMSSSSGRVSLSSLHFAPSSSSPTAATGGGGSCSKKLFSAEGAPSSNRGSGGRGGGRGSFGGGSHGSSSGVRGGNRIRLAAMLDSSSGAESGVSDIDVEWDALLSGSGSGSFRLGDSMSTAKSDVAGKEAQAASPPASRPPTRQRSRRSDGAETKEDTSGNGAGENRGAGGEEERGGQEGRGGRGNKDGKRSNQGTADSYDADETAWTAVRQVPRPPDNARPKRSNSRRSSDIALKVSGVVL